jgi:hypothetical protein
MIAVDHEVAPLLGGADEFDAPAQFGPVSGGLGEDDGGAVP